MSIGAGASMVAFGISCRGYLGGYGCGGEMGQAARTHALEGYRQTVMAQLDVVIVTSASS